MTLKRHFRRLRFNLWMLGAADIEGFEQRAWLSGRMKRLYATWSGKAKREQREQAGG